MTPQRTPSSGTPPQNDYTNNSENNDFCVEGKFSACPTLFFDQVVISKLYLGVLKGNGNSEISDGKEGLVRRIAHTKVQSVVFAE